MRTGSPSRALSALWEAVPDLRGARVRAHLGGGLYRPRSPRSSPLWECAKRHAGELRAPPETGDAARPLLGTLANLGYFYGPISALAYATGYVARKQGLLLIPDGPFGTMVGSLVGSLVFVLAAQFIDSYRKAVCNVFATFNPWLFAAGALSSVGQIFNFVALNYSTISRVALISSMEVFLTIFLSIGVFRTREKLSAAILIAAGLGVAGTAFVLWR